MSQENLPADKPTLEDVRNRFESWRKHRKKRSPIPKSLWKAAVGLSEDYSICRLSKALHLNYTALRNQILEARNRNASALSIRSAAFLELPVSPSIGPVECTVEMERNDGAKMKMYVKGNAELDLLELGKAFWSNGS